MKDKIAIGIFSIVFLWVFVMLVSLKLGWLDRFFFAAINADVQGIDYFSLPKAFLNLLESRSMYDTWGGTHYGPHSTWYLSHPAFIVFVASFFSFFTPWTSYSLFVVFTIATMAYAAKLIAEKCTTQLEKSIVYVFLLVSFPMYWLLYTGNSHAPTVLGLTFLFLGMYELLHESRYKLAVANSKIMIGLLICLFTKPIVLIMLPMLLLLPETRVTTFKSIVIYGIVSLLFLLIPVLNPEFIGLPKVIDLLLHPNFVKENMNIYQNHFVLNAYMKDNSIHWLNLIAQSDYYMNHIEIFSLSSFVNTLAAKQLSPSLFKLPLLLSVLASCLVFLVKKKSVRLELALFNLIALSLTFFLSYNTVWEYQFTSVAPVLALLFVLRNDSTIFKKFIPICIGAGAFIMLPSLFFLLSKTEFGATSMLLIRSTRVVPLLFIYIAFMYTIVYTLIQEVNINASKKKQ